MWIVLWIVLWLSCDCLVIVLWTAAQGEGCAGWIQRLLWGARLPHRGVLQQVAHIGMLPSRCVGHAVVDFLALLARVREWRSTVIWDFFW